MCVEGEGGENVKRTQTETVPKSCYNESMNTTIGDEKRQSFFHTSDFSDRCTLKETLNFEKQVTIKKKLGGK